MNFCVFNFKCFDMKFGYNISIRVEGLNFEKSLVVRLCCEALCYWRFRDELVRPIYFGFIDGFILYEIVAIILFKFNTI